MVAAHEAVREVGMQVVSGCGDESTGTARIEVVDATPIRSPSGRKPSEIRHAGEIAVALRHCEGPDALSSSIQGEYMRDHPDARTYLRATEAFQAADLDWLASTLHEDVVWHVPGESWPAGDVKGRNQLLEYLKNVQIQTGGTFVLEDKFVSATDDHVLAVQVMGATLDGEQRLFDVYSVMRFEGGLQRERTFHISDLQGWDDFFG